MSDPRPDASRAPFLAHRQGRLELDGVPVDELTERIETPFFLVSERRLLGNYRALLRGLAHAGSPAIVRYCAKTNHEAGLLAPLARAGSELLASHRAEVELALECGFPAARIAYQRPAPSRAEAVAVLAAGVTHLHVLRPEEAELFLDLAPPGGRELRLSLRLRPPRTLLRSPLAGLNARLGLSTEEALAVARRCRDRGAPVVALNVYVGTQRAAARAFDRALARACALARRLAAEGVARIEEINVGGGVPSPSLHRLALRGLLARCFDRPAAPAEGFASVEAFGRELATRYRAAAGAAGLDPPPALAAEPGRAIVGNAALLVTRVTAAEGRWLFLDASRNYLGESPLLFRRDILPLREATALPARFVHLSGSTLNTTDVVDLWRRLPRLVAGDVIAICDAGAYSISRATRYAGLSPAVLLVTDDGRVRTIRRPESCADLAAPMAPAFAPPGESADRA